MAAHQTIAGCTNRKVTLLAQAAADGNADFVGSGAQPSLLPGGGSARCAWPAARTNANQAFVAPAWSGDEWRIRALIEGASDPVAVISQEGVIAYISSATKLISGYDPSEYVGRNLAEFVHPQDANVFAMSLAAIIANPGTIHRHLCRHGRKDGSWFSVETSARNLLDDPLVNGIVVS